MNSGANGFQHLIVFVWRECSDDGAHPHQHALLVADDTAHISAIDGFPSLLSSGTPVNVSQTISLFNGCGVGYGFMAAYPYGPSVLGGVPFNLADQNSNRCWYGGSVGGAGPTTLLIPLVGVTSPTIVYIAVNTFWGAAGGSYARVEFLDAAGVVAFSYGLVGNVQIRDYNANGPYTLSIQSPPTTNVFTTPDGGAVLDMTAIAIPPTLASSIVSVRIVDSGSNGFQRLIVFGVTVAGTASIPTNTPTPSQTASSTGTSTASSSPTATWAFANAVPENWTFAGGAVTLRRVPSTGSLYLPLPATLPSAAIAAAGLAVGRASTLSPNAFCMIGETSSAAMTTFYGAVELLTLSAGGAWVPPTACTPNVVFAAGTNTAFATTFGGPIVNSGVGASMTFAAFASAASCHSGFQASTYGWVDLVGTPFTIPAGQWQLVGYNVFGPGVSAVLSNQSTQLLGGGECSTVSPRGVYGAPLNITAPLSFAAPASCPPTPTTTPTASSTASATGTPSSSRTGNPSHTSTRSSSRTRTPSSSPTGTPSSSTTGTPSSSQTGTPSSSTTGTPSSSHTSTSSSTPTLTPQPTILPVSLGSACGYAVLASATITSTGPSVLTPGLALSPGTSVTGFPPGLVTGAVDVANAAAAAAQEAMAWAMLDAGGRTPDITLPTIVDVGGRTLVAGVYAAPSSLFITGTLTLDGGGEKASMFIFQIGSTLITASHANVVLINGASASNVVWLVGSSATLGTYTTFSGTILATASVTVTTGASITGAVMARYAAVTLDSNVITSAACGGGSIVRDSPNISDAPADVPDNTAN